MKRCTYQLSQTDDDKFIMSCHAHVTVFCHCFVDLQLFYLVTETYPLGSGKEMRKWAYEIHSTFLCDKSVICTYICLNFVFTVTIVHISVGLHIY